MNALGLIELALAILKTVTGLTKNSVDDFAVEAVEAAIEKLESVKNTAVTREQLESLRVEKLW